MDKMVAMEMIISQNMDEKNVLRIKS